MNRYKLKSRIKRYGPSELLGTLGALIGGYGGFYITGNQAIASFAAAWMENVGYYGYTIWQESREQATLGRQGWKRFIGTVQDIVTEFGFSELVDSLLIRPGLMYLATSYIAPYGVGLLVGKFLADIVFYIPTTYFYQKTLKRDIDTFLEKIEDRVG